MSEIEKMYKFANVKAINVAEYGSTYIPNGVEIDGKLYPPFTAEKQLNLIILLANREIRISPTYMCSGYRLNDIGKVICSRNISTFENSLAQHINAIWQDLTEEEKQQVKGILE